MSRVLICLQSQFPEYQIEVIEGDCADYNGKTERYRKWVVGVRRRCMRAAFPLWKELLLLLRPYLLFLLLLLLLPFCFLLLLLLQLLPLLLLPQLPRLRC